MPKYLFLKKRSVINFMEFFEMSVIFLQNKQLSKFVKKKIPIYRYARYSSVRTCFLFTMNPV